MRLPETLPESMTRTKTLPEQEVCKENLLFRVVYELLSEKTKNVVGLHVCREFSADAASYAMPEVNIDVESRRVQVLLHLGDKVWEENGGTWYHPEDVVWAGRDALAAKGYEVVLP